MAYGQNNNDHRTTTPADLDLLAKARLHLVDVTDLPSLALDVRLLESLSKESLDNLDMYDRCRWLNCLSALLQNIQQDPTPAISLIRKFIDVPGFSFEIVLRIEPKVDFVAGLESDFLPFRTLTTELLETARHNGGDIDILASMDKVVFLLLKQLLSEEDVALYLKTQAFFVNILTRPPKTDLMWRRILDDVTIYEWILWYCSLEPRQGFPVPSNSPELSKQKKTIGQSRLLALVAKVDCEHIRISHHRDLESMSSTNSLLDFAVNQMVDYKRDVMMHLTLMQFFSEWILRSKAQNLRSRTTMPSYPDSSPALHYMEASGLHARTVGYYHSPSEMDSFESKVLYSQAACYLEVYYLLYPKHAMNRLHHLLHRTLARINIALQNTSLADFALRPPKDLRLLVALPRAALLLQEQHANGCIPVYLQLPCASKSSAIFDTLAALFGGDEIHSREIEVQDRGYQESLESTPAAARALYFLYLNENPSFWEHVVKAAETLALKEACVSANNLIKKVIDANWQMIEDDSFPSGGTEPKYYIRSEQQLVDICGGHALPPSGPLIMLSSPALEIVLPYLLKPAQTSSNLGVGGKADQEGTVNTVAAIKFDALSSLHDKLKQLANVQGAQWWDIVAQLEKRLAQGRWGGVSGVGGSIATMEQ